MDAQALAQKVSLEVRDTANDIDAYLASDVPIECYRKDIDAKLMQMKVNIEAASVNYLLTGGFT